MSKRLAWSRAGFMRRVGMASGDALFVIVEGRDHDRLFYGELCESSSKLTSAGYQIRMVEQTQKAGSGGKDAVLAFYREARARRRLTIDMGAGKKRLAFCVDNDGDELIGLTVKSPNLIYTHMHDVEAEIFAVGQLMPSLGLALGLDRKAAGIIASGLGYWIDELSAHWDEWIRLCVLAKATRSRCSVGYGKPSAINSGFTGDPDYTRIAGLRAEIEEGSLLSAEDFAAKESDIRAAFDDLVKGGGARRLVKGRWMRQYLVARVSEMTTESSEIRVKLNGVDNRLVSSFAACMDLGTDSAVRTIRRLERLVG